MRHVRPETKEIFNYMSISGDVFAEYCGFILVVFDI